MTDAALLGVIAGCGLLLIFRTFLREPENLAARVARFDPREVASDGALTSHDSPEQSLLSRTGSLMTETARQLGLPAVNRVDLTILERQPALFFADTALAGLGGGLVGLIVVPLTHVVDIGLPPVTALPLAAGGASLGFLAMAAELRSKASSERTALRHAVATWLELVVMAQAGGMGLEGALMASASISCDPCFLRLRQALERASFARISAWTALERLGTETGLLELEELGASLELASVEGARIRTTLGAKSISLRRHLLAESVADANATTERLFLPSIVLMLAFLVFLMFPAAVELAHVF